MPTCKSMATWYLHLCQCLFFHLDFVLEVRLHPSEVIDADTLSSKCCRRHVCRR
jgi:hypothetical protein